MNSTYKLTPGHVLCPDCGGSGDVHHPRWGKPSCPTDLVRCHVCNGRGEIEDDEPPELSLLDEAIAIADGKSLKMASVAHLAEVVKELRRFEKL